MFVDLICANEEFNNLGFSKIYKVEIIKIKNKTDLKKLKNNEVNIVLGGKLNRPVLENKKINILLSPERDRKEDFLHHRNSGLNHVLCKLAKKNDIAIAFSFNDVLKSSKEERAKIIGRMMQNVKLCRKYKLRTIVASFAQSKYEMRNANDLISFGICIGLTAKEAKDSLMNYEKILKKEPLIKIIK